MQKIVLIESPTGEERITSFRYPPMGLLAISSYLDSLGYEVEMIDAAINNYQVDEIVEQAKKINAEFVGISSMSVNIGETFESI